MSSISRLRSDFFWTASQAAWKVARAINSAMPERDLAAPPWAPGRLLKRKHRPAMDTGIPRRTLSLCPDCNREAADAVVRGESDIADLETALELLTPRFLRKAGASLCAKPAESMARLKTYCPITRIFSEGWKALLSAEISIALTTGNCTITVPTALDRVGDRI